MLRKCAAPVQERLVAEREEAVAALQARVRALEGGAGAERDGLLALVDADYDLVVTSPLQRCSRLAEHIPGGERRSEPRIMEYDFGDWELRPWAELRGPETKTWMHNFVDEPAPNGESMRIMQARVLDYWNELLVSDYAKVAVVTHSGVQRLIHAHVLHTPLTHIFRLELAFGEVIRVNVADARDGHATLRHL